MVDAGWSSPVARQAHNLKVAGSNPAPATNAIKLHTPPLQAALSFQANTHKTHRRRSCNVSAKNRTEEHTSELKSLMRNQYAVCCWKKKNISKNPPRVVTITTHDKQ